MSSHQGLKQKKILQLRHTRSDLLASEGHLLTMATEQIQQLLRVWAKAVTRSVLSDLALKVTK